MKEYKLSRTSKYSVLYLLSGLFMFFFMFAILSLNSHAATDYVLNITSSNGSFFETSGLYSSFSSSLQHPEYAYPITTVSGSSSFTRPSGVESVSLEVHVVTSKGDFVVDTHQGTGSYEAFSSVKLEGYPIGYYGVCKGYLREGTTSTTMTMNVSCSASVSNQTTNVTNSLSTIQSNTNQIIGLLGGSSSDVTIPGSFSDYSSYSPVSISATFETFSSFGLDKVPAGSLFSFYFENYTGSTLSFADWINFSATGSTDFIYVVNFDCTTRLSNADFLELWVRGSSGSNIYTLTSPTFVYTGAGTGYFNYTAYFEFTLPSNSDFELYRVFLNDSSSGYSFNHPSYSLLSKKYTIDDYMKFNQDQWTNINPSVTDTNTNTSQTVSDINTINSFESTTFNNFDTLADSSGLNSFSLTSNTHVASAMNFLSTCIVTVYNGFPSDLKWLIQCIGIFGIFALLLSVFGRVGKRINNE